MVLCWLWNLELVEPLFVTLLRTGTEDIQWKLVGTGRQERKDQWKRARCAHQATALRFSNCEHSPDAYANGEKLASMKQLHAQIAAVSKALTELEASEDKELMQPLESRLTDLKARLHGTRPIGQQVDGLRGVISRCQKRLAEAEIAKADAEATIIKETEDMASHQTQLAELEPLLTISTGFRKADEPNNGMPEWVASTLSSNRQGVFTRHFLELNWKPLKTECVLHLVGRGTKHAWKTIERSAEQRAAAGPGAAKHVCRTPGGIECKVVPCYKHVGSLVNGLGRLECELQARIAAANRVYHPLAKKLMSAKHLDCKTKAQLFSLSGAVCPLVWL